MAVAEDRLALSGEVRVRAWTKDNYDFDTDDSNDDYQFWDQRFRMMGVITPADGVKAVFRMDFAEDIWGSNNWNGSRYNAGVATDFGDVSSSEAGEIQVDRAYIDVTKGIVNVIAGQAYFGLGNLFAYDNNQTGVAVTLKTPLTVRAAFMKIDEDQTGSYGSELGEGKTDDGPYEDLDHYLIDLGYKADTFSVNVFYVMQNDSSDVGNEPTMLGAFAKFAIGPVNLECELDSFGGDNGMGNDYVGTQFLADATMKMSDVLTLGAKLIYSDGTDDTSEEKIVRMPNAFFGTKYHVDFGGFAPNDSQILGNTDVMDPDGTQAGAMGGGLNATFKPMEALTLAGQVLYLTGVEDSDPGMFDSGYVLTLTADYMLVQNAWVTLGYAFADIDYVGDIDTDSAEAMMARLLIKF